MGAYCGRRWTLERKLAASNVSEEEQLNLLRDLERKETEFIRLRRLKISVDDFELLTIIGRGASGEVVEVAWLNLICRTYSVPVSFNTYLLLYYRWGYVVRSRLAIFLQWKSSASLKCYAGVRYIYNFIVLCDLFYWNITTLFWFLNINKA